MRSAELVHWPKRGSVTQSPKPPLRSKHGVLPASTTPCLAGVWFGCGRACLSSRSCAAIRRRGREVIRQVAVVGRLREFFAP